MDIRPSLLALALLTAAAESPAAPRADRYELGGTPVLTGNSDIGFGFGALASLARLRPGCAPYCWRLEGLVLMTVKDAPGGAELPYHNYYLKLDLPSLLGGKLRLYGQLSFSRFTNNGYYGLGNGAPALDGDGEDSRFHQYDRIFPHLSTQARLQLIPHLSLLLGGRFTYNWITVYQPSRLAEDLEREDLHDLLRGVSDHALVEMDLGWVWDSRDHELVPTSGMLHEISWRFVPGTSSDPDLAHGGLNLTARAYHALWGERLVVAARVMADLLLGQPPFYELAHSGGLFPIDAIGGGTAIRGVPQQRYHGKIKLLANLELRSKLVPFSIKSQRFNLGATVFADTGRVWADYAARDDLDGGPVLKLGLGGGMRLQWGETFLLRADVAWSPDARPVGVYVDVNHIF